MIPNTILTTDQYKVLSAANTMLDDTLRHTLNKEGFCNWTVCPVCGVDEFVHSSGCSLMKEIES